MWFKIVNWLKGMGAARVIDALDYLEGPLDVRIQAAKEKITGKWVIDAVQAELRKWLKIDQPS